MIEIVVPVYNEAGSLQASIWRLHDFLDSSWGGWGWNWTITIADNASTDATPRLAQRLADHLDRVEYLRLEDKGRGRALRTAWGRSDADVVVYMDADLSTDLRALLPLVAPLVSGHSDIAIGTRLARGAQVTRGVRREVISRGYNALLHATLRARFSDAQCGFKAVRAAALPALLGAVRNDEWFFDTELLIAAQRRGLRIHEVPVDWVEDPDSSVAIAATVWQDLRGIARLAAAAPIARFMAVGVLSTLAYGVLFLALRGAIGPAFANGLSLAVTAVANTAANRRLTFRIRGRAGLLRQHAAGALVFILTLGLTTGALGVLHGLDHHPARPLELTVLVVASLVATVTRYIGLRSWVFARRQCGAGVASTV